MKLNLSHTLPLLSITSFPLKCSPPRVVVLIHAPFCCHIRLQKVSLHTKGQWNIQNWPNFSKRKKNPKQTMILGRDPKCEQHLESLIFMPSILNISTEFLYLSEDRLLNLLHLVNNDYHSAFFSGTQTFHPPPYSDPPLRGAALKKQVLYLTRKLSTTPPLTPCTLPVPPDCSLQCSDSCRSLFPRPTRAPLQRLLELICVIVPRESN